MFFAIKITMGSTHALEILKVPRKLEHILDLLGSMIKQVRKLEPERFATMVTFIINLIDECTAREERASAHLEPERN